ncbi:hypothetical protein [Pedobacter sp. SL55]|uniref:hypothetical protein n=1 Tax=Pedobacter sp. SL55 TaxID=2995161 RepID=UPI00226D5C5D|nr:hypothetical protein [Pedobacter sp. SL55]WAC40395.1 hypothetical protein OVA16_17770 [Pedobacter sp. SL55]
MKINYFYIILSAFIIGFNSCSSVKTSMVDQFGPNKSYSSITLEGSELNGFSTDVAPKWVAAEKEVFKTGSRKLNRLVIKFTKPDELDLIFIYSPPTGGNATATFTYTFTKDEKGNISLSLANKNANAKLLSAAVSGLTVDYFEKYKFKLDWATKIVPGSYGTLAGLFNAENPTSYVYGKIN